MLIWAFVKCYIIQRVNKNKNRPFSESGLTDFDNTDDFFGGSTEVVHTGGDQKSWKQTNKNIFLKSGGKDSCSIEVGHLSDFTTDSFCKIYSMISFQASGFKPAILRL